MTLMSRLGTKKGSLSSPGVYGWDVLLELIDAFLDFFEVEFIRVLATVCIFHFRKEFDEALFGGGEDGGALTLGVPGHPRFEKE